MAFFKSTSKKAKAVVEAKPNDNAAVKVVDLDSKEPISPDLEDWLAFAMRNRIFDSLACKEDGIVVLVRFDLAAFRSFRYGVKFMCPVWPQAFAIQKMPGKANFNIFVDAKKIAEIRNGIIPKASATRKGDISFFKYPPHSFEEEKSWVEKMFHGADKVLWTGPQALI